MSHKTVTLPHHDLKQGHWAPRSGLPSGKASYAARIRALYAAVNVRRFGRPGFPPLVT
jgi:hypothetical protein